MADCSPSNTPFVRGPQGPRGMTGLKGPQGPPGIKGDRGLRGDEGPQGETGVQGPQGDFGGPQGSQGAQGDTGAQGATGAQGITGAQGAQGVAGTGAQGSQGAQGNNGGTAAEGARVTKSTNTVLAASTPTVLSWNTVIRNDNAVYAGGSPTKLTATSGGWYALSASVTWAAATAVIPNAYWRLTARKGGTTIVGKDEFFDAPPLDIFSLDNRINELIYLSAGEYIEILAETNDTARNTISSVTESSPLFSLALTQGVTGNQGAQGSTGVQGAQGSATDTRLAYLAVDVGSLGGAGTLPSSTFSVTVTGTTLVEFFVNISGVNLSSSFDTTQSADLFLRDTDTVTDYILEHYVTGVAANGTPSANGTITRGGCGRRLLTLAAGTHHYSLVATGVGTFTYPLVLTAKNLGAP